MEYRLNITFADRRGTPAPDPAYESERLLDGFLAAHPEVGPVTGANLATGELDVTIALDAADANAAIDAARPIIAAGIQAAGFDPPLDVVGMSVERADVDEAAPARAS